MPIHGFLVYEALEDEKNYTDNASGNDNDNDKFIIMDYHHHHGFSSSSWIFIVIMDYHHHHGLHMFLQIRNIEDIYMCYHGLSSSSSSWILILMNYHHRHGSTPFCEGSSIFPPRGSDGFRELQIAPEGAQRASDGLGGAGKAWRPEIKCTAGQGDRWPLMTPDRL